VVGNFLGTDPTGSTAAGNCGSGLFVNAASATIDGTAAAAGNVISANSNAGALLVGASVLVQGNRIGTDATGEHALGNGGDGVLVKGASATIGGTVAGAGNLISANSVNGIALETTGALVQGNLVGIDAANTTTLGNGYGIAADTGARVATIGGTSAAARNVVSGNVNIGIDILGPSALVEGNYVGVDATGANPRSTASSAPDLSRVEAHLKLSTV
jgi:hypothetical protein